MGFSWWRFRDADCQRLSSFVVPTTLNKTRKNLGTNWRNKSIRKLGDDFELDIGLEVTRKSRDAPNREKEHREVLTSRETMNPFYPASINFSPKTIARGLTTSIHGSNTA